MSEVQTAAPAKGRSKLLVIGLPVLVLLLLGGGGAGWWYMQAHAAPAEEKEHAKAEVEPTGLLALDAFTVNLADPGGRRYLRVGLQLVVPDAAAAKKAEEEELLMSRLRSAVLETLAERTALELTTTDGRTELKKKIAEVASHIGHLDVRDVLFQEFVVQ